MQSNLEVALDNDDILISYQQGQSGITIISFTGVGHQLGSIQTEEFRRSLTQRDQGQSADIVYIIDKQRKWYNDQISGVILRVVNELVSMFQSKKVVTLGNSMGGFGALALPVVFKIVQERLAFLRNLP